MGFSRSLKRLPFENTALIQGIYYLPTALWPLFDVHSFMNVTGPKTDLWLVKTLGLLLAVIGAVLLIAGFRRKRSFEFFLLGAGSAAVLAAVEAYYVSQMVIMPIYLLDAAIEVVLFACWLISPAFKRKTAFPPA